MTDWQCDPEDTSNINHISLIWHEEHIMSKQKSNQIMNRKLFVILRLELQTFALILYYGNI